MMKTCAVLLLAACSGSALAQSYTFEMRLIADGQPGAPGGPGQTYPMGGIDLPTRIGFWLQARVAQTTGQNWGITRASSPSGGGASFITLSDSAGMGGLRRGTVNSGATLHGRGVGYRNGGANSGPTGNAVGNAPFPGGPGNENGGLDNGGAGFAVTRIYSFDAYLAPTGSDTDLDGDGDVDDNGDGVPEQPWRVNGAGANAGVDGVPHPSDGTFAPWASLYRFYVDLSPFAGPRTVTINASALLNGAVQASPTGAGGANYAMQLSAGELASAVWTFTTPTPGAAALLAMGGTLAARRRR